MKMVMSEVGMDGAGEFESHREKRDTSRKGGAKVALRVAVRPKYPKIIWSVFSPTTNHQRAFTLQTHNASPILFKISFLVYTIDSTILD